METEEAKALVRRFIDQVFVSGRVEAIDELVAPDFVSHSWGFTDDGRGKLKAATTRVHDTLTDVDFTIEDVVAEGDRVVARLTSSAAPTGDFMGMPAAGKHYSIGEIHWFRIADGRIAEHWHHMDTAGLMKQLGG